MKYCFYIIYSHSIDRYYLGHTSELEERIRKYNSNYKGFTGKANDWKLVYSESFPDKSKAYERERQVKNWKSRERIKNLIAKAGSVHPD